MSFKKLSRLTSKLLKVRKIFIFCFFKTILLLIAFCSYSIYSTSPELIGNKKKIDAIYGKKSPQPLRIDNNFWYLGSNSFDHHNVEILKSIKRDVTLAFFDAHSDDRVGEVKLDCGNWINWALKNPHIKRVVWLGGCQGLPKETHPWENYKHIQTGDVVIFPARNFLSYFKGKSSPTEKFVKDIKKDSLGAFFDFPGYSIRWFTFREATDNGLLKKAIFGKDIFITIDLDVLAEEFGITPWGNGLLTDVDLKNTLSYLYKNFNVVGITACGPEKCLKWLVPYVKEIESSVRF